MGHYRPPRKGGQFLVQQAEIGSGDWDITQMTLKMAGKILLLKRISIVSDETLSDYRRVPDNLSFAQGVEMLKAETEKRAHDSIHQQPQAQKNSN